MTNQEKQLWYTAKTSTLRWAQKYDMGTRIISPTSYVTEVIFKDPVHTRGQKKFKMVEVTHTKR